MTRGQLTSARTRSSRPASLRVGGEGGKVLLHRRVGCVTCRRGRWRVEGGPAQLTRALAHRRVVARGRPLRARSSTSCRPARGVRRREVAIQDRKDDGARRCPGTGEGQPVAGILERGRPVERLDAVVRERAREQAMKRSGRPPRRRPASAGTRAGTPAGCGPARGRSRRDAAAPARTDRCTGTSRRSLVAQAGRSASARSRRRDVIAEHQPSRRRGSVRGRVRGDSTRLPRRPRGSLDRISCSNAACAGRARWGAASNWRTRPANGAVSDSSIFMLSTTATTSPAATSSPRRTGSATTTAGPWLRTTPPHRGRPGARRRGPRSAGPRPGVRPASGGCPADREPALVGTEELDPRLEHRAADGQAPPARADVPDAGAVGPPAVAQVDRPGRPRWAPGGARGGRARRTACAPWPSRRPRLDRRLGQRGVRVPDGLQSAARRSRSSHIVSISPAGSSGRARTSSRNERFVVPPSSTATVLRSARRRRAAPRRGRGHRDHVGDHRVELGRDLIAHGDAAVHTYARACRESKPLGRVPASA